MKCPKCKEELFSKPSELGYTPPCGEWDCLANITTIVSNLLNLYPDTNIELSKKEFQSFMTVLSGEVMTSILLDKRLINGRGFGINKILHEGFDFRGIKIRLIK